MRRRPGLALVAAVLFLGALTGPASAPAGAEPGSADHRNVVATGRAQGLRATYTVPDYVVVSEFFDGGGPVTESVADSTGRATSFSSLPWPGENAVTAPGTLSVAIGQSVPLTYPFNVRADYPTTPSAELHDPTGTYAISAAAEAGRAVAAGAISGGGGASGSSSHTSAVLDDGGVVRVLAETADTGLSVGDGLLRIASVRSRSETTLAPTDTKPVTSNQLVVEGATVAGHAVTIAADGVHAGDQTVPAPVGQGASSDNELLGQAGISVTVAPTGRPGSADALVITSRQAVPAPNNPKGTLVLRVGGASSEIVVGSADGPVEVPAVDGSPADGAPVAGAAGEPGASFTPAQPAPSSTMGRSGWPGAIDAAAAAGYAGAAAAEAAAGFGDAAADASSSATGVGAGVSARDRGPVTGPLATTAGGGQAALRAGPAVGVRPAPVVPDLATTGALFSLLAFGAVALLLATRLHRLKVRKVRA